MINEFHKSYWFPLIALVMAISADVLFYKHDIGISMPIFTFLAFAVLIGIDRAARKRITKIEHILIAVLWILSVFFAVRDAGHLLAINSVAMIVLSAMIFGKTYGFKIQSFDFARYLSMIFIDFPTIWVSKPISIGEIAGLTEKKRKIIIGIIAAVAVSAVFIALFVSADEVAREILVRFIERMSLDSVLRHIVIVAVIGVAIMFVLHPIMHKAATNGDGEQFEIKAGREIQYTIIFAALNLVFAAFLIIQGVFLIGGADISEFGITYSDYATQGFYQLMVVSVLVGAILWFSRYYKTEKNDKLIKILKCVLLAQTAVVIFSAWTRIMTYVDVYGLTVSRVYAVWALLVILSLLAIILVVIFKEGLKNGEIIITGVIVAAVWIAVLNVANPDLIVARVNIEREENGIKPALDIDYLMKLSDDSRPFVMDYLTRRAKMDASVYDIQQRENWLYGIGRKYDLSWQALNWSRREAIGAVWVSY
ncbi:MAG: DUF4173 domain-containing protein [Patescibacteria group bacterium]